MSKLDAQNLRNEYPLWGKEEHIPWNAINLRRVFSGISIFND